MKENVPEVGAPRKEHLPAEFREGLDGAEARVFDTLWDGLDEVLPEPPSGRLRRGLRRMILAERLRAWGSGLSMAGMATALVVGLVLGRLLFVPVPPPTPDTPVPDLRLETQLLSGATTAARLGAIVNLREAQSLPGPAAAALAGLVANPDSSAGIQIAALEALLAHARQPEVQGLVIELLDRPQGNPMVEALLREARAPETDGRDEAAGGTRT